MRGRRLHETSTQTRSWWAAWECDIDRYEKDLSLLDGYVWNLVGSRRQCSIWAAVGQIMATTPTIFASRWVGPQTVGHRRLEERLIHANGGIGN